jgi:hypothetical protein
MKTLKRRLKRFAIGVLIFVAVVAAIAYGTRAYMSRIGQRELDAVSARLTAEDPGWQIGDIEAARQRAAPPPEQNSAPIMLRVADMIAADQNKAWNTWRASDEWTVRVLSPNLPREKVLAGMRRHKESTTPARELARDLRRFPSGYHPVVFHDNPYMTLLPHVQKAREVGALLEYDAWLAAVEKNADGGIVSAHAALNAARSIGAEPFLISQLVRIACCRVSTQTAVQVLAWGEPKQGLAELQAAYRAEADEPWLLNGLRGERAMLHRAFEGMESGKLTGDDLVILGMQKPGVLHHVGFHFYKGLLPGDHAKALEILTAYITAAKLPHHEQRAALAAIPIPPGPPDDFRYIITRLLIPACEKVALAALRERADLLCASAAIACERFRQARGRWPERLDEIPREILPDLPPDPFTGQPLRYHKFEDGIAVYSVGDGDAATTRRQFENKDPLAGLGQGWRLWNPEARGRPAPPEPKPVDPPQQDPP